MWLKPSDETDFFMFCLTAALIQNYLSCRFVVRKCLGYGVSYKIHCLPLPTQIKLYLDLCDLDDLWVTSSGHPLANTVTDEEASETDSSDTETESDHFAASSLVQSPSF